jgi:D-3-phosphoglycerate dehydrogenase / 2-oxoglutarate reductase
MTYKILCTDGFSKAGLDALAKHAHLEVTFRPQLKHEELLEAIGPFDGLIVRSASKVGRDVIERGKNLKIIARAGVGVDNIDVDAATERGILVVNAPAGNTISAAELSFAMLLSLARHIPQASHAMTEGRWEKKKYFGTEIAGKTLGVIGMGRIGREVARRARGFDMVVLGFDPYLAQHQFEELGVSKATVEEILRNADFITIHTPLTKETENLISAREFAMMKPTVCLINCARGGIINEKDLAAALREKRIAAAALDVYTKEPYEDPMFRDLENCICTPHLGASTAEAQDAVAIEAAASVAQYFTEGLGPNAVNLAGTDPFTWQRFKSHIVLAERLGALVTQLADGKIQKITFLSQAGMPRILALASAKGALSRLTDGFVTYVNAEQSSRERGIAFADEVVGRAVDFADAIGVRIQTERGETEAWGVVLADGTPKVVRVGEYRTELDPAGAILFIHNADRPGVIGRICTILGTEGVNIAEMQNVRTRPGAAALTVIGVAATVTQATMERIRREADITGVRLVQL